MLAFAAKEQYSNLPEPSLRLSVMGQNLFFVLCAAHDDANAILRRKPLTALCRPDKYSGTVAPLASITMGQNRIDQTVFHRFRGGKEAIALGITFNLF